MKKPSPLIVFGCLFSLLAALSQPFRPFSASAITISQPVELNATEFQQPDDPIIRPGSDIRFFSYTAEQGLSMSVVNSIAQDHQGFMWFATQDGLNRFDGKNFKILKHNSDDPNSLSANFINAIYTDSTGLIWIGTEGGGLDRYNPAEGTFTHFQADPENPESISSNKITSIYEDRSGFLWLGTDEGVDRMNRRAGKFTHFNRDPQAPEAIRTEQVNTVYQDRSGDYWFGTKKGLIRFTPSTREYRNYKHEERDPASLSKDEVTAIYEDRTGRLWVGTEGGGLNLLSEDGASFTHYSLGEKDVEPGSAGDPTIKSIEETSNGFLWIGTWGHGLVYFDPQTGNWIRYTNEAGNPYSLGGDFIVDIFRDKAGSVWIGTFGGGLSKFDLATLNFTHYRYKPNSENSLISNMVWAIYDQDGLLWIGTERGLDRLDRSTGLYTHYQHDPEIPGSLSANNVRVIFQDSRGLMWFGTGEGGLNLYNPQDGTFESFKNDPGDPTSLSHNKITAIEEDRAGSIWVATIKGLNRFDRGTKMFTRFLADPENPYSLGSDCVTALIKSQDGSFWLGTDLGLERFDPSTGKALHASSKMRLPAEKLVFYVLTIHEDPGGILWIGTVGRGMLRFDPATGQTKIFTEKEGMPNETVYGILPETSGNLWLSTNNGLVCYDPAAERFTTYFARDGIQSNEFNSYAYHKSPSGELFFGGINGVTAFYPAHVQGNSYIPPVVLVGFTINGDDSSYQSANPPAGQVVFKHPQDSFEFEFTALSYVQPERNQYAYLLENFDSEWNQIGTKNFGRYTNLPGGDYTLRLRASNNQGVWNEEGSALSIRIIPPFWETLWFRLGLVLAGLMVVLTFTRLRMRGVETHSRQLETLVQERTHEIERRRQELEALYSADEALYRNLNLDQVLHALVESAVSLLHADKGALLVLDDEKKCLTAKVTHGFSPETVERLSFALGEGIAGIVAQTGEPILTQDASSDERVPRRIKDAEGIHSIMQVPIKVGGEVFGVFSADFIQPHTFGSDDLRLLMSLAQRAALAIQNAQLYEETQEKAIAEERNRLARELHDAVTQTLFSASLIAEALPTAFNSDPDDGRELLNELRQLNRGALAEMRALLLELRPSALAEANLEDLLRQLGEAAAGREGIPVSVQTNGHCSLPPEVHIALYRIAQEALNNALKHSRADQIAIKLAKVQPETEEPALDPLVVEKPYGIQLMVSDNGRGFDPADTPSDHLGLKIMRERAQAIGAQLTIDSKKGRGTQVSVFWED